MTTLETNRRRATRARRMGLAISAVFAGTLHALLLLGFNTPAPTASATAASASPESLVELFAAPPAPEEAAPKPDAEKAAEDSPDAADAVAAAALPEPISTAVVSDISQVLQPSAPEMPRADAARWSVPASQVRAEHRVPTETIFDPKDLDKKPQLLSSTEPAYPFELEQSRVAGLVVIHFVVDPHGKVRNLEVVSAPHPLLGSAATRAVANWAFRAGMKNGRFVSTDMQLPIRFRLP